MPDKIIQFFDLSPDEFKEKILQDIKKELDSIAQKFQQPKQEEYLTRKQVATMLQVSLVTIHDWNQKKILNPYRLGNLIRYKRSEIDQALIRINSKLS